jgi:hypothetical protein
MDLVPVNKGSETLHYNWSGWRWLIERLIRWGVDISEFAGNDGELISDATCKAVADALEKRSEELLEEESDEQPRAWVKRLTTEDARAWRQSGGFWQY